MLRGKKALCSKQHWLLHPISTSEAGTISSTMLQSPRDSRSVPDPWSLAWLALQSALLLEERGPKCCKLDFYPCMPLPLQSASDLIIIPSSYVVLFISKISKCFAEMVNHYHPHFLDGEAGVGNLQTWANLETHFTDRTGWLRLGPFEMVWRRESVNGITKGLL